MLKDAEEALNLAGSLAVLGLPDDDLVTLKIVREQEQPIQKLPKVADDEELAAGLDKWSKFGQDEDPNALAA